MNTKVCYLLSLDASFDFLSLVRLCVDIRPNSNCMLHYRRSAGQPKAPFYAYHALLCDAMCESDAWDRFGSVVMSHGGLSPSALAQKAKVGTLPLFLQLSFHMFLASLSLSLKPCRRQLSHHLPVFGCSISDPHPPLYHPTHR